jgi:UDP-2,3-diacylglucosamine hydrolase
VINLFISDLHLEDSRPDITDIFFRFLRQDAVKADALYILGDFFEAWIGDDNLTDFNLSVMAELKRATDTCLPLYIMHGNRDFLLGKVIPCALLILRISSFVKNPATGLCSNYFC